MGDVIKVEEDDATQFPGFFGELPELPGSFSGAGFACHIPKRPATSAKKISDHHFRKLRFIARPMRTGFFRPQICREESRDCAALPVRRQYQGC
jgi:hypothetical protein